MTSKKVPMRQCIGCMEKKPKKELVRVVKDTEGAISMDITGKKSGRGAYLCNSLSCLQAAQKARRLERSLSCRIPDEVYQTLEEEMKRGS